MKCPYQTVVIHMPQYERKYSIVPAKDITTFCGCVKRECPFYYTDGSTEHCRRAESEKNR